MKIAKSSEKGWQCLGAEPFLFTLPGPARDPARKYTPRDRELIIPKHPCTHQAPNTQTHTKGTNERATSSHYHTSHIHPSDGPLNGPHRFPPIILPLTPPL